MTHTLDEIKKMLEGISPWPWYEYEPDGYHGRGVEDANGRRIPNFDQDVPFITSAPQIISELVEEVEYWQKRHADLSNNKTNEYHAGYKDGYDEAKHGAEARYSLVKELREEVQALRNKDE